MDLYIPKRRIPVTLWSEARDAVAAQLFMDMDAEVEGRVTLLDKLNESSPFLTTAQGPDGRIHLVRKAGLLRVTPGRTVLLTDVFVRGFDPWREEEVECVLRDGSVIAGRLWMPLARATQRLSDFMNQIGDGFFVLLGASGPHLVRAGGVAELKLAESAGAPLEALEGTDATAA
jgi:hypothetical protein